jgi:hypothetical protein
MTQRQKNRTTDIHKDRQTNSSLFSIFIEIKANISSKYKTSNFVKVKILNNNKVVLNLASSQK